MSERHVMVFLTKIQLKALEKVLVETLTGESGSAVRDKMFGDKAIRNATLRAFDEITYESKLHT